MNLNSYLKLGCFALAMGTSVLSTAWQLRDIESRYLGDYVGACLTIALVTTICVVVYRRRSWPIWCIACVMVGTVGSLVYFNRAFYRPQFTFPLPTLFDIHDTWVPTAYVAFTFATLAGAFLYELSTTENIAPYRLSNRLLLGVACLMVIVLAYAWAPFDNSLTRILKSTVSNDVKLAELSPFLKVGDDFRSFRSRVRDYAVEDLRLDYQLFSYTFNKCGLQVVTFADNKVYAIGALKPDGCEWLVRPGDLMWPGDPANATCAPYFIDHRIQEILNDCYATSYAARKAYVNYDRRIASPESKLVADNLNRWECDRLLGRLSLYVVPGQDGKYFLRRMKEQPSHETSANGQLHLWRFPTSGLLLVSENHTSLVSRDPTQRKTETIVENKVVDIGCTQGGKTHWFVNRENPIWPVTD